MAIIAVSLTPTPPAAAAAFDEDCHLPVDYTGRAAASLCWPVPHGVPVVIEGPARLWKLRVFAERLDAGLPGLDVRSAACAGFPGAFCVRVLREDRGATWQGYTDLTWTRHPDGRLTPAGAVVTLNLHYRRERGPGFRRTVAAHELMHALGFRHHGEAGVVGPLVPSRLPMPSSGEWAALTAWYG